jgi:two-component system phosphate regulon response regulator PhoB
MPDILLAAPSHGGYFQPVLRRIKDLVLAIVEDNAQINESLADYFGAQNKVFSFSSAEDTLAVEEQLGDVQVFIIDYLLPGMTGSDLFARLRVRYPHAKYILITGEMNYEVAETNRELGWNALILKPFDFSILEDNISVLVSATA